MKSKMKLYDYGKKFGRNFAFARQMTLLESFVISHDQVQRRRYLNVYKYDDDHHIVLEWTTMRFSICIVWMKKKIIDIFIQRPHSWACGLFVQECAKFEPSNYFLEDFDYKNYTLPSNAIANRHCANTVEPRYSYIERLKSFQANCARYIAI